MRVAGQQEKEKGLLEVLSLRLFGWADDHFPLLLEVFFEGQLWGGLLVLIIGAGAFVLGRRSGPPELWFDPYLDIGIGLGGVGMIALCFAEHLRPNSLWEKLSIAVAVLGMCSWALTFLFFASSIVVFIGFALKIVLQYLGPFAAPVATIVLAGIGYGLFLIKVHYPMGYARMELTFAGLSCYIAVDRMRQQIDLAGVSVVLASAYLVVRGLENRKKALEMSPRLASGGENITA